MSKLNYANSPNYAASNCIIFGANTQFAGTAPTFSTASDRQEFSGDAIRRIDNRLHSLPENFKLGNQLWDDGNLQLNDCSLAGEVNAVTMRFQTILQEKKIPICLGGDHIIKYAALSAIDKFMPEQYGVVYIDAHPDCEQKDTLCYSSILHHGFLLPYLRPQQLMLVGIRQFTINEASSLQRYQPEIGIVKGSDFDCFSMQQIVEKITAQFKGLNYLYFSIDLDGLDPSCAPAVESPYPGGPSLNQIIYLIQQLRLNFNYLGMDISEFIPKLDNNYITALSAARILKEFYSVV